MRFKVFAVIVLLLAALAAEEAAAAPCEPRADRPVSSRYLPDGVDRDPDTPGVQCADHLYDMDGRRPNAAPPVAPTAAPPPVAPSVAPAAAEPAPPPAAPAATPTAGPSAPAPPAPRVWWNGEFMTLAEFLCFQDAARNPFVDTLESTGCAASP